MAWQSLAMRFSQRHGYKPVREALQIDSMDDPLRNGLWDCLLLYIERLMHDNDHQEFMRRLWRNAFEEPIDTLSPDYYSALAKIRTRFYEAQWYGVYDILESVYANVGASGAKKAMAQALNKTLEARGSAYRLVNGEVVAITDETEIASVESALADAPNAGARRHLGKALALLSDREAPDYANSIKESISAVESTCSHIVGRRTTLGDTLKVLEDAGVAIHPALRQGWRKLYGYTSDSDGIRHATIDETTLDAPDALYFLVTCSAFVNLLVAEFTRVGGKV